ncbi:MAG: polysaccharide deacetylase family protein [Candidatus Omnitrophica bacterium]|nr:polysaccharide deacetylase family protein [Candidatus Omnitrophota bacterium]
MAPITPSSAESIEQIKRALTVICILLVLSGSFWLIWIDQHRVVPVIMYHHIDETGRHPVATVPTDHFEKHLRYLRDYQFEVLPYDDYIRAKQQGEHLSRKTVVLTFDDGYADNYTNAFPLLRRYGYPAVMFISTDKVGQPGYVTWDQLREMAAAGITIGSHAIAHEYLPGLPADRIAREITESRRILEQRLGIPVRHFSYPVGGFNDEIKQLVRQAGYVSAVTTNRGFDRFNKDFYELNRVTMDEEDLVFPIRWAKFSGYYNLFRKAREPQ